MTLVEFASFLVWIKGKTQHRRTIKRYTGFPSDLPGDFGHGSEFFLSGVGVSNTAGSSSTWSKRLVRFSSSVQRREKKVQGKKTAQVSPVVYHKVPFITASFEWSRQSRRAQVSLVNLTFQRPQGFFRWNRCSVVASFKLNGDLDLLARIPLRLYVEILWVNKTLINC